MDRARLTAVCKIQIVLGILWLLDGLLQLQHQMFTNSFSTNVIDPAAAGQPIFISGLSHLFVRIFLYHPAIFNSFVAITQSSIGILILWKKTVKYGLLLSVAWGLFVWYVGEGAGGIFGLHTLLLMGMPGAALLYALISIAVMPSWNKKSKSIKERPAYWLKLVWAILWIGGAIYQVLPGQNSISDMSSMIAGNSVGAPGWMANLDLHVANFINGLGTPTTSMSGVHMNNYQMANMQTEGHSGVWFIILIALIQVYIGLVVFLSKEFRISAVVGGVIFSLIVWVIGQSLGGYYTGVMTDPNTAPLFILMGISILSCEPFKLKVLREDTAKIFGRFEQALT